MHPRNRRRRGQEDSPIIPGSELLNDSPQGHVPRRDGVPVIPTPDPHSPRRGGDRFGRSPAGDIPGLVHAPPGAQWGFPPAGYFGHHPPGSFLSPHQVAAAGHTGPRAFPQMPQMQQMFGGFPPGFAAVGGPPPPGQHYPHPAAPMHGNPYPHHPGMGRHVSMPYPPAALPHHGISPMHHPWGVPPPGSMPMMYSPLDAYGMPIPMGGMGMGGMLRPNEDMPIDRWAIGNAYAPVLEPLHLTLLNITLDINPLLLAPPDDNESRAFLSYNLLFSVTTAHRSDDSSNRSWSKGRYSPATFPRVSTLLLMSHDFPWIIPVNASDAARGVTCYDVLNELHHALKAKLGRGLWGRLNRARKREIGERYTQNRSTWPGAPGADLGNGIRRIDYLVDKVIWDGLSADPKQKEKVMSKMGMVGRGWNATTPHEPSAPAPKAEQVYWPAVLVVHLDVRAMDVDEGPRFGRRRDGAIPPRTGATPGPGQDTTSTTEVTTSTDD